MSDGNLFGPIDLAQLAFYVFVLFFIGLVLYLRREDRREGYPVEDSDSGVTRRADDPITSGSPKRFSLPFDRGVKVAPSERREPVSVNAKRTFGSPGAPYVPNGDPMTSGMGPGAFAQRDPLPDLDAEGRNRIVPNRLAPDIKVAAKDPDPRGMSVYGTDGNIAGKVSELWVDRAEHQLRYLEVSLPSGKSVLLPMAMSLIKHGHVHVDAITAAQFEGVPALGSTDQITRLEEEKVTAYYGAGYLYATPDRAEPIL